MKYIFIILTAGFLFSCKSYHPQLSNTRIIEEFNTHYFNDSLKLAITFAGDHAISTDSIDTYYNIFKKNKIRIKRKDIIGHAYTTGSPHYRFAFALSDHPVRTTDKIMAGNHFLVIQKELSDHYLVISGFSGSQEFDNMQSDLEAALSSVKFDSSYSPKTPEYPFRIISRYLNDAEEGNYLKALVSLRNKEGNYQDRGGQFLYQQAFLTIGSMIYNAPGFDSTKNVYDGLRQFDISKLTNSNKSIGVYDKDATEVISTIADTSQLVMFNESHWDRRHRKQVLDLLEVFQKSGYNYIALEALYQPDSLLHTRGYPLMSNGFYTREPVMAQIVRKAIALGYNVVGYEAQGKDRESEQAINLYERTFAKDPNAKVLVLAGFDHINEGLWRARSRMAGEFKERYKIDPVTIDQTRLGLLSGLGDAYDRVLLTFAEMEAVGKPGITTDFYLFTKAQEDYCIQDQPLQKVEIKTVNEMVLEESVALMSQLFLKEEFEASGFESIPLYNHFGLNTSYNLMPGEYIWMTINFYGEILQKEDLNVLLN